jgi:hypothetical protein
MAKRSKSAKLTLLEGEMHRLSSSALSCLLLRQRLLRIKLHSIASIARWWAVHGIVSMLPAYSSFACGWHRRSGGCSALRLGAGEFACKLQRSPAPESFNGPVLVVLGEVHRESETRSRVLSYVRTGVVRQLCPESRRKPRKLIVPAEGVLTCEKVHVSL